MIKELIRWNELRKISLYSAVKLCQIDNFRKKKEREFSAIFPTATRLRHFPYSNKVAPLKVCQTLLSFLSCTLTRMEVVCKKTRDFSKLSDLQAVCVCVCVCVCNFTFLCPSIFLKILRKCQTLTITLREYVFQKAELFFLRYLSQIVLDLSSWILQVFVVLMHGTKKMEKVCCCKNSMQRSWVLTECPPFLFWRSSIVSAIPSLCPGNCLTLKLDRKLCSFTLFFTYLFISGFVFHHTCQLDILIFFRYDLPFHRVYDWVGFNNCHNWIITKHWKQT